MEENTVDKADLEKEKLGLEIKDLRTRWFLKPSYLSIMLTATIAIVTFIATVRSGIIDTERKTLELRKAVLEKDIKDFEAERKTLVDSIVVFKDSVSGLKSREREYLTKYKEYQRKERLYIQKLRDENKKDEIIEYYKSRLDSMIKLRIFDETFDETFK